MNPNPPETPDINFFSKDSPFWAEHADDPLAVALLHFEVAQLQLCVDSEGALSSSAVLHLIEILRKQADERSLLQAIFLLHILSDQESSSQVVLARSLLQEAENLLEQVPAEAEQRLFMEFLLKEKRLSFLIENDHNFDAADRFVEEMWQQVLTAEPALPNWLVGVFVNNALEVYSEQGKEPSAKKIIEAIESGTVCISNDQKRSFLIKSAKIESDDEKSFQVLEAFMGKSNDLTPSVSVLPPDPYREDCEMWATREWLLRNPHRKVDEYKKPEAEQSTAFLEYKERREDFFKKADAFDKKKQKVPTDPEKELILHGKDWQAQILKQEALDFRDPKLLREAIDFYASCDAFAFHRVGVELILLREFKETFSDKMPKSVILKAWEILEAKLGRRVVEYFIESIPGAREAAEKVASSVDVMVSPTRTRRMQLSCRPLPSYLQDLAQVIINVYQKGGEDSLDTFRRASRDYYRSRQRAVQQEVQELKFSLASGEDLEGLLEGIGDHFEVTSEIKPVSGQTSTETEVREYVCVIGEEEGLVSQTAWRQEVLVHRDDQDIVLRKASDPALFPDQIKMIEALLDPDKDQGNIFTGSVRAFLSPIVGGVEVLSPQDIEDRRYLPQIQHTYASTVGVPPAPDAKQWVIVASEDQSEVLASLALAPLSPHTMPFVFHRFPSEQACEEALAFHGVGMDECLEAGTLSLDTFVADPAEVFVPLFYQSAQQILDSGKKYTCVIAHRRARMIYKEYGFELKEVSLPEGYEPLGDAEMQEQAQIHLGIGPEAFELWQKNYLSRDTRIIILSAEQAQASLRAKYPQFCQPSSSS